MIVDARVDNEPALGVGRTNKARTNPAARGAVSTVAADNKLGAQRLAPAGVSTWRSTLWWSCATAVTQQLKRARTE